MKIQKKKKLCFFLGGSGQGGSGQGGGGSGQGGGGSGLMGTES